MAGTPSGASNSSVLSLLGTCLDVFLMPGMGRWAYSVFVPQQDHRLNKFLFRVISFLFSISLPPRSSFGLLPNTLALLPLAVRRVPWTSTPSSKRRFSNTSPGPVSQGSGRRPRYSPFYSPSCPFSCFHSARLYCCTVCKTCSCCSCCVASIVTRLLPRHPSLLGGGTPPSFASPETTY